MNGDEPQECGAENNDGYVCSLDPGHPDPEHIALDDLGDEICRWPVTP